MPIYDQTFRRYEGPRSTHGSWRPVALQTMRPILKSKLAITLLIGTLIWITIYSVMLYVSAKLPEMSPQHTRMDDAGSAMREQGIPFFGRDTALRTILYDFVRTETILIWLLLMITGGGSISADLRHQAMPLYFSRPLRPRDYIFGKIIGLAFLPVVVVMLAVVLIYMQAIAYFFPASDLWKQSGLLLASFAYVAGGSLFAGLLMAAFSSASRKASTAAVVFLGFHTLTVVVARIAQRGFRAPDFAVIAPYVDLQVILYHLFRPDLAGARRFPFRVQQLNLTLAITALTIYILGALWLLRRNVRVVEVVK